MGQWECDVEAEAVIGGQTRIIRGGLKLPKEQPASDLAPQDAHKPVDSVLLLPPTCIRRDSELGSDERFQSVQFREQAVRKERNRGQAVRIFPAPRLEIKTGGAERWWRIFFEIYLSKEEYFWSNPSDRHGVHVIPETAALIPGECFLHSRPDVQWEAQ